MNDFRNFFKSFLAIIMFFSFYAISCTDPTEGDDDTLIPSNLKINFELVGKSADLPHGDGSGMISFNLSADHVKNYKILIDQELIESSTGVFEYKCKQIGTRDYKVVVSAYNGAKFVSESMEITVYVKAALLWSDEFNYNGTPDNKKWSFEIGNGSNGWGNNEKQYYTARPDNAIVENGVLKIKTLKENFQGFGYTSARMISRDFFTFKYGIIEFRAKLPEGKGTWPALWMLGNNIGSVGWPACGEIDVMEHVGNQLNKIYGTVHHPGHSGSNPDGGTVMIENVTKEFRVYKVDWSPDHIRFYVDDQLYYTFANAASLPFNQPYFIIMNCAMGGNFGGTIDPSFQQSVFEIDYVRVYQ